MPWLRFAVELPEELHGELNAAAKECAITPARFAAEAIHSVLASRRLESIAPGKLGARVPEGD
jgi:hypothetical protein